MIWTTFIGVSKEIANEDACVIEHELNPKTIEQIKSLVSFIESTPDNPEWLDNFEAFCRVERRSTEVRGSKERRLGKSL